MADSPTPRPTSNSGVSSPLLARTISLREAIAPVAYDCVKLMVLRNGSAMLSRKGTQTPVRVGDVILLTPHRLCGIAPERQVTVTVIYADTDYLIDQVFWQHAGFVRDRFDARQLAEAAYSKPLQVLRIGEGQAAELAPLLDEFVALSAELHGQGVSAETFYRMQALWFSIAHVVAPSISTTPVSLTPVRARHTFRPLRTEAMEVRRLLRTDPARRWRLSGLAKAVHLSPRQLSRVFIGTYGKTPLAYLTMLRAEEMARLLRETDMTIAEAGRAVGWSSRGRASRAFREHVGVTPSKYRRVTTADAA